MWGHSSFQIFRITARLHALRRTGNRRRQPCNMAIAMKFLMSVLIAVSSVAFAQQPPAIVSPDVQAGGKVTFRFLDPNAKDVKLSFEGEPAPLDMTRDEAGVWSITLGPLSPEIYGYIFIADGVFLMDPNNPVIKPNLIGPQNTVHVPGT